MRLFSEKAGTANVLHLLYRQKDEKILWKTHRRCKPDRRPCRQVYTTLVNANPPFEFEPEQQPEERNWLPMALATAVVVALAVVAIFLFGGTGKRQGKANDAAYASRIELGGLTMSESANLAGGKQTYLDGRVANRGDKTVTAVVVEAAFRDGSHAVVESSRLPLSRIRTRQPYVDTESFAIAPLAPGQLAEFRLIFDAVKPTWNGSYPELHVVAVETK